jgi:multiple sugar transport system permease protein
VAGVSYRQTYRRGLWLLLLPFLAGAGALVLVPAVVTAGFAFTRYDGLAPAEFVGLQTYRDLLTYSELQRSLVATAVFVALAVPLRVLGGLALALLLHRRERLATPGRLAVYTPAVLPDAATALVFLWLVNPVYGPLALGLQVGGGESGPLLLDRWGARLTIVAVAVFALGEGFLVTLAARREIPEVLYDVARLEGARGPGLFRRVTLPLLAPVLGLLSARDLVVSMQVTVVPVLLLTQGGPLGATKTLPVLVYERGFRELRFGDAAALALLLFLLTVVLVAVQFRLLHRWTRGGAVTTGGA